MEVTATIRRASPWLVELDPARAAAPGAIARSGSTTAHPIVARSKGPITTKRSDTNQMASASTRSDGATLSVASE